MAKILIADVSKGATRLFNLLQNDHDLVFAHDVEAVVRIAKEQKLNLLIVGVLFDYSRMYDLVYAVRTQPELKSLAIVGFSDEHTATTMSSRDSNEALMHLLGATDYVDTLDMTEAEVAERINRCIEEAKPVGRKVVATEESPRSKRNAQEFARWNERLKNAALRKQYKILLPGVGSDYEELTKKLNSVDRMLFQYETVQNLPLENEFELIRQDADALILTESVTKLSEDQKNQLAQLKTIFPVLAYGIEDASSELYLPRETNGLQLALALIDVIEKKARSESRDSALIQFALRCLAEARATLKEGASLSTVLSDFCRAVEDYAALNFNSDIKVSVMLTASNQTVLSPIAAPSLPEEYVTFINKVTVGPMSGSCGTAAHTLKSVFVTDISKDARWEQYRATALKSNLAACWSVPLIANDGSLLGTFALYNTQPRNPSNDELDLIGTLSTITCEILEQATTYELL